MGASNAFQLRGRLPEDKKRLLDTFDKIILEYSEEDLRYYRKNSGIYNRLSLLDYTNTPDKFYNSSLFFRFYFEL